jgi:cytidine deaminase
MSHNGPSATEPPPDPRVVAELLHQARTVRSRAHVPHSGYAVGAALRTGGGTFAGCNIENAAFGLTLCAEQVAVAAAVAAGRRDLELLLVLSEDAAAPCGACRQVLHEFAPELHVVLADPAGVRRSLRLPDLLPEAFGPDSLACPRG